MEVEKRNAQIIVNITQEEIYELQRGRSIYGKNKAHGDRPAVTMPDANFAVSPLKSIEPDDSLKDIWTIDRLRNAKKAQLKARLLSNGDLEVFIPDIALSDVRLGSAKLPRELIETPGTEDSKGLVEHVIPEGGIQLNFGGSLKIINIPDFYL